MNKIILILFAGYCLTLTMCGNELVKHIEKYNSNEPIKVNPKNFKEKTLNLI